MQFTIGVDIGGTFTDFVVQNSESSKICTEKVLTTPDRPREAVLDGLFKLEQTHGIRLSEVGKILHATTLATNALIERKGALTGLLTTAGFEDVLDIRKGLRYNQYDLKIQFPPAYVPRYLRSGVSERILASGKVHKTLVKSEVLDQTSQLVKEGIKSLAICFLNSYANPDHEIVAREVITKEFPDLTLAVSHEVTTQAREYERMSTVAIDAYVKPLVKTYIDDLDKSLRDRGFNGKLLIMTCSGGVVETSVATKVPVRLLESGPVAGTSISAEIAKLSKIKDAFSFDMGGTTAKGCVLRNSTVEKAYEFEAARVDKFRRGSGVPVSIPTVKLIEIGSGGGSIAKLDPFGLIRVGPESSGANPGPACYGFGGKFPTVTDSDLVLGYLDENFFLGGSMRLEPQSARESIDSEICAKMKNQHGEELSISEAAWAIHERVNEDVAAAFRIYASEMGADFRKYSFIPFGGAGPMHAVRIAKKLRAKNVIVPPRAGVLSAEGLIVSPLSIDLARATRIELSDMEYSDYSEFFEDLIHRASSILLASGIKNSDLRISRSLDMCYHGQGYDVPVRLQPRITREEFSNLRNKFELAYKENYSVYGFSKSIDITGFKIAVSSPPRHPSILTLSSSKDDINAMSRGHIKRRFRIAFDAEKKTFRKFELVQRQTLKSNDWISGPMLIQERESTVVLPTEYQGNVDRFHNLLITERRGAL